MLDADPAKLYGVTTFNLNKAVKRNIDRFPEDFMFRLSTQETVALTFQIGISKPGGGEEVVNTRPTYSRISHYRKRILLGNKRLGEVRNA